MHDLARITWVVPGEVAISDFSSVQVRENIESFGIRSVLSVSVGAPSASAGFAGIREARWRPLLDGENHQAVFDGAVELADELRRKHGNVLIHCREGRSRSTAVAAALLSRLRLEEGLMPAAAVDLIVALRPGARVHSELMNNVRAFQP